MCHPAGEWTTGDGTWCDGYWVKMDDFQKDADSGAICLAVLRRDGFISLDAGEEEGMILTESFTLLGDKMFVNVDALDGELRVEVLDGDGKVLAASASMKGDLPRQEVQWSAADAEGSVHRPVRLRFSLRQASLYSYWFEERPEVPGR